MACEWALYDIGFCCGLRGEKIPKADVQGILNTEKKVAEETQHMLWLPFW